MDLLADRGRLHAYAVKRALRSRVGHSSVYAALAAAQAKGFLRSEWELPDGGRPASGPPRKYYELTAAGRRALAEAKSQTTVGRVGRIATEPG